MKPKALVLTGDGINCEQETSQAFELAGFDSKIRHLNDLIAEGMSADELAQRFSVLALPGGFSFGDDLTSGKVLALKIQHGLKWNLAQYVERGGLVIGICNGFQALVRMGVFGKEISITSNVQGKFLNTWVTVVPSSGKCAWLKGCGQMDLPIRHGEGRVIILSSHRPGVSSSVPSEVRDKMERSQQLCLRYDAETSGPQGPNGSDERLAGLCDVSGRIFGLMPHPEAFVRWTAHPEWTLYPARASAPGQGLSIFENAFREASRAK